MSAELDQTPYDPVGIWADLPLGSVRRAEVLSEVHDRVKGRLIYLSRRIVQGVASQHEALERARLWPFHDWLERETIDAYAALPAETAEKLRSGEPLV